MNMLSVPGEQAPNLVITLEPTYQPGNFSLNVLSEDGNLKLSNGLAARPIATSGEFVELLGNQFSDDRFHIRPDGAATFKKDDGGWYYVSNAENDTVGKCWECGGVGSIEFNADGEVIDYKKVAIRTRQNCGGGRTPWNSWVSCEETDFGRVYQVDPSGLMEKNKTDLGTLGAYESFAFDVRADAEKPTFYVTRDAKNGVLTRFTPNDEGMRCFNKANDYDRWCTLNHGTIDYLLISGGPSGTFEWTSDYEAAKQNAIDYYPNSEGIDVVNGMLYTTSKILKRLTILNLRTMRYTYHSTKSGAFNQQPDQVARVTPNDPNSVLYFCEDGGQGQDGPGVHGRGRNGQFFSILQGTFPNQDETTGLSFSPDGYHMYVSFQKVGTIYDIWRTDNFPFQGAMLDIKYHAVGA
jgi:hypothetical protein